MSSSYAYLAEARIIEDPHDHVDPSDKENMLSRRTVSLFYKTLSQEK